MTVDAIPPPILGCDMAVAIPQAVLNNQLQFRLMKKMKGASNGREVDAEMNSPSVLIRGNDGTDPVRGGHVIAVLHFKNGALTVPGGKSYPLAGSTLGFVADLGRHAAPRKDLEEHRFLSAETKKRLAAWDDKRFDVVELFLRAAETDLARSIDQVSTSLPKGMSPADYDAFVDIVQKYLHSLNGPENPFTLGLAPCWKGAVDDPRPGMEPAALAHAVVFNETLPKKSTLNFLMMIRETKFPADPVKFRQILVPRIDTGAFCAMYETFHLAFYLGQIRALLKLRGLFYFDNKSLLWTLKEQSEGFGAGSKTLSDGSVLTYESHEDIHVSKWGRIVVMVTRRWTATLKDERIQLQQCRPQTLFFQLDLRLLHESVGLIVSKMSELRPPIFTDERAAWRQKLANDGSERAKALLAAEEESAKLRSPMLERALALKGTDLKTPFIFPGSDSFLLSNFRIEGTPGQQLLSVDFNYEGFAQ